MKLERKESLLNFIIFIGMIGAIVNILPECFTPRLSGRDLDVYFDFIVWAQYGGAVLLTLAEVTFFYFLLKMEKTTMLSFLLQIMIAADLLSCVGGYFDCYEYSETITFGDVASWVYLIMCVVVGEFYIIRRKSRIMGISMICLLVGLLVTGLISNSENHNIRKGFLTALPAIGAIAFFFESSKRYLMRSLFSLEEDESSVDPSLD